MNDATNRPLQRFAVLTAAMTLCLILAGGFVTTTKTGDAISGWPFLWGKLEPGFPIEWTHRAFAMVVAGLVGVLTIWTHLAEKRAWVRRFALIAFAAVLVQAAIGGVRIYLPAATIAIIHACFAQVVFCVVSAIALFVSPSWREATEDEGAGNARRLGAITTALAFLQLVAGAVTRHTGAGMTVHLVGAFLVILHAAQFSSKLVETPLKNGASLLLALVGVQVLLGFASWGLVSSGFVRSHQSSWTQIATISAHVAVGASVLLTSFVLTLRCHRAWRLRAPQAVPA